MLPTRDTIHLAARRLGVNLDRPNDTTRGQRANARALNRKTLTPGQRANARALNRKTLTPGQGANA